MNHPFEVAKIAPSSDDRRLWVGAVVICLLVVVLTVALVQRASPATPAGPSDATPAPEVVVPQPGIGA